MNPIFLVAGIVMILAGIGGGLSFILQGGTVFMGSGVMFAGMFILGGVSFLRAAKTVGSTSLTPAMLANGLSGTATILAVNEGGMHVRMGLNSSRLVSFTMNVMLPGRAPYQISNYRAMVPDLRIGQISPGNTVAVRVDPANPQRMAIDWNATVSGMGAGGMNPGAMGMGMNPGAMGMGMNPGAMAPPAQQMSAAELLARGRPARAMVMQTQATGQTLPDGRVVLGFVLQVTMDGAPPFQAQLLHAVPQDRLGRTVAGTWLPVAVDPANPTRAVAINWDAP